MKKIKLFSTISSKKSFLLILSVIIWIIAIIIDDYIIISMRGAFDTVMSCLIIIPIIAAVSLNFKKDSRHNKIFIKILSIFCFLGFLGAIAFIIFSCVFSELLIK